MSLRDGPMPFMVTHAVWVGLVWVVIPVGNSIPFLPASYFLRKEMAGEDEQTKSDRQAFLAAQLPPRSSMWIVKPAVSGRGIGISVVRTKEEVLQVVNNDRLNQTFVVQEYLERPHILMKRKYDIRQFVLVCCTICVDSAISPPRSVWYPNPLHDPMTTFLLSPGHQPQSPDHLHQLRILLAIFCSGIQQG